MEPKTQRDLYLAQRLKGSIGHALWLGGHDSEMEGTWVWDSDGSRIDMDRFWANGKPDFAQDHLCLGNDGNFHDCYDSDERAFICSLPAIGLED